MSATYPQYPHSNFPDELDSWEEFLDIVASDATLLNQYQQYVLAGDMENAQYIYRQIPNADRKFIGALVMNQFADAIMSLEQFYGDGGFIDYITSKQNEWQIIIDQFSYIGIYSATTQYHKNNIVLYNISGQNYLYINTYDGTTPLGTLPTNPSYWRIITIQGQKGEAGSSTTFYFNWDSSIEYHTNNVVCIGSSLYVALQDNVNNVPYVGSEYWERIFTVPQQYYPVQANQPEGAMSGDLWFRIIQ
jgi:hypothetical protein